MSGDHLTDENELRGLRDSLSGVATPARPRLEAIKARGMQHRRHRRTQVVRLSVAGTTACIALSVGLVAALSPASGLGTIHAASYTLRHNQNGTDTLTLNPKELLSPSQLQSDFAKYGIPAKVTTGSYCSSDPEPAGFAAAVTGPGPGTWGPGVGPQPIRQPTITIDPSKIPAGTELTVGDFHLTAGPAAGAQEAEFALMKSGSYTCTSTPPDLTKPDTSNGNLGLLYGGGRSGPAGPSGPSGPAGS
jgi:hypothetical protein